MYSDYLGNSQIIKIYDHSLSSEEVDAIKKYRELSKEGKRLVRLIINEEYSRTTVGNQLTPPPAICPVCESFTLVFLYKTN